MTTYLGKRCSFCLPRVPFVNCRQFMYLVISLFGFEGRIWDLIVSVPDHCLSFYFRQSYVDITSWTWLKLGWMCIRLVFRSRVGSSSWQHSYVEMGHLIISTAILSLLLIQVGQLSIIGGRMCT